MTFHGRNNFRLWGTGLAATVALAASLGSATGAGATAARYSSDALAINNRGLAVGELYQPNVYTPSSRACVTSPDNICTHAARFDKGGPVDLGTLGGPSSGAHGINDRGVIVGGTELDQVDPAWGGPVSRAFVIDGGVMRDIGTLGGTNSVAWGVNARGQVVGGAQTATGDFHAFIYAHGKMQDLGTLGGTFGFAHAINDRGDVAGFATTAAGLQHAVVWSHDAQTQQDGQQQGEDGHLVARDLGTLGGSRSRALGINSEGEVVGVSRDASGVSRPFLWRDGVMKDLGSLGGGFGIANGINDRGEIVGMCLNQNGFVRAFRTDDQGGPLVDLGTFGGDQSFAYGLNSKGQIVGGADTRENDPNGNPRFDAFLTSKKGALINLSGG